VIQIVRDTIYPSESSFTREDRLANQSCYQNSAKHTVHHRTSLATGFALGSLKPYKQGKFTTCHYYDERPMLDLTCQVEMFEKNCVLRSISCYA
jgi:hypothetical protein